MADEYSEEACKSLIKDVSTATAQQNEVLTNLNEIIDEISNKKKELRAGVQKLLAQNRELTKKCLQLENDCKMLWPDDQNVNENDIVGDKTPVVIVGEERHIAETNKRSGDVQSQQVTKKQRGNPRQNNARLGGAEAYAEDEGLPDSWKNLPEDVKSFLLKYDRPLTRALLSRQRRHGPWHRQLNSRYPWDSLDITDYHTNNDWDEILITIDGWPQKLQQEAYKGFYQRHWG